MGKIKRVPHCSHWGAYTILVQDDRIVGVEPFEHDPAPSPIIQSITEWASPERRVLRPMVRSGVTDTVRQGVVVLPTGAWFTPTGNSGLEIAGNTNVLTLDVGTSKFGQGCSAHSCLVHVEPYADDAGDAIQKYQESLVALAAV